MKKIILAAVGLSLATLTQAGLDDYLPPAKLKQHQAALNTAYVGVGMTAKLVHLNPEIVTPYGIAYAKLGVFSNGEDPGAQVGFRFPYHFTGVDQNGYYVGVYAGHTENAKVDDEQKQRLGAGIDLSYVLLDKQRISTASVGIGASEKLKGRYGSVKDIEPKLQFAYSLSFGVF